MYDGKKFKELRKYLDINQKEAATALEISQPYYSALEQGKRELNQKIINKIKTVFNIDSEFFKEGNEETYLTLKTEETKVDSKLKLDPILSYSSNHKIADKNELYNGGFDENQIDFYYKHSEYRLDKLLSFKINILKEVYVANNDLVETVMLLTKNNPAVSANFSLNIEFNTYKNKIDKELKDYNAHITDEKLFKAIRVNNYIQLLDYWYQVIIMNINKFKELS